MSKNRVERMKQEEEYTGEKQPKDVTPAARGFTATETALEYSQKLKHRFVDMKTRKDSKGNKKRKAQHPIHNKIVWGHYNNIVHELAHGYTDAVKQELKGIETIK